MKRLLSISLAILLALGFTIVSPANELAMATPMEGSGTVTDPYQVSTPLQLQAISNDLSAHYILINDIDCTHDTQDPSGALYNGGLGFEPIGGGLGAWTDPFVGTFDGNNKKITGLYINRPTLDWNVGLFGYVDSGAVINDVILENVNISGGIRTGGLVSWGYSGDIINCGVTGNGVGCQ